MKQIIQSLKTGKIEIIDVPAPKVQPGCLLIKTEKSLISPGTERMLLDFGKAGWINKARQQPDKVRQVIDKIKTDGMKTTLNAVKKKIEKPVLLGYSNVGKVIEIGEGVKNFKVGDRVLSNGKHAEIICVPKSLTARIPENVSSGEAVFGVLGAISLHGIRLAEPSLGEIFLVQGLGIVGLLSVQILLANGCQVICFDLNRDRVSLSEAYGAHSFAIEKDVDPVRVVKSLTDGVGADGLIICAATKSNDPINQAPHMCRKKGRVILIGVVGLDISRDDFFRKEISFQVSCSYGPGRYDSGYEEKGLDYPIEYVRWTENRNFKAVLQLMAKGKLHANNLISDSMPIQQADILYEKLSEKEGLGYLIEYPGNSTAISRSVQLREPTRGKIQRPAIAFVGAGNFAGGTLVPAFSKTEARLKTIASLGGVSGFLIGKKYGFEQTTTDFESILKDPDIAAVVITTRHDSHGRLVMASLEAGKSVFVEKPLCTELEELDEIKNFYLERVTSKKYPMLMVGFNRRFSPLVQKIKALLGKICAPKACIITVNAGEVPFEHWTQDMETGGGRLIGEACHFIDLLRYIVGAKIVSYEIGSMKSVNRDTFSVQLEFDDGSIGTVHYLSNGNKSFPKERLETFCDGRILNLDNFRTLRGYGWKNFEVKKLKSQDKGHANEASAFISSLVKGEPSPIPLAELFEVTEVILDLDEKRLYGERRES